MYQNQERPSLTWILFSTASVCVLLSNTLVSTTQAEELAGDWSLDLESGLPAWMSIQESEGKRVVYMRLYVVSALFAPLGLSGLSQLVKPMRCGYLPVINDARVGEQTLHEL